jgi:translation initiation factor 3 subunit E
VCECLPLTQFCFAFASLQVGHYLDRHLVFPLLEFLQVQGVYPEPEILQAKIDLLQKTNMVDFALDIHATLHGPDTPNAGASRPACLSPSCQQAADLFAPLRPGGPASGSCE